MNSKSEKHIKSVTELQTRIIAVQCVYIMDIRKDLTVTEVLAQSLSNTADFLNITQPRDQDVLIDEKMVLRIVRGVNQNVKKIDEILDKNLADDWTIDRIATVTRAILRAAGCEILILRAENIATLICDYLEIAKLLNHGGEIGFLNKILDQIKNYSLD